jgi:hypothetical protein
MKIGRTDIAIDDDIAAVGFTQVESMKILGIEIDNKLEHLEKNFGNCIVKMNQICANWNRFRLTLPGRIGIAKAMLLSQLSYPGTILEPTNMQLEEMNVIIERFVTQNIVIAKERIYCPVKKGGLGMIKLSSFLDSLKCIWIKRCAVEINDSWRWEFSERAGHNIR